MMNYNDENVDGLLSQQRH